MPELLLVDDDADHRMVFEYFLSAAGYQVRCAVSADTALALTRAQRFDAAVLDLRLPGVDGIELCRQLRRRAAADLPILVVSAEVNTVRIQAALAAGADDYLSKPTRRAELIAAVDMLLTPRIRTHAPADVAQLVTRSALPSVSAQLLQPAGARRAIA